MQDKINYYSHNSFTPSYYHRQYEHDLPENKEEKSSPFTSTKRAIQIALPFLSLYRPLGSAISLGMGSTRVLTSGISIITAENMTGQAHGVMQLGLASLALAGTAYNFTLGLYLTSAIDLLSNISQIGHSLIKHEYKQAGEELLQSLCSGLYLAIIMTGSLEVVLTSLLIQALSSFYQAQEEWRKGKTPEAIAKTLIGMIRLYQGQQQLELLLKRNALLAQYSEFATRIQKGRKINHLWDHPLVQVAGETDPKKGLTFEKHLILEDAEGKTYDFGTHFHGYGKQTVKGMNISFREVHGKPVLEFKVNHVFRDRLEAGLQKLKETPKEDVATLLQTLNSQVVGISSKTIRQHFPGWSLHKVHEIRLDGLGKITIGSDNDVLSLYDRVTVEMDKGKNLYDFHEALCFLDLDDALRQSAQEDIERMKMGQLYRFFVPKEATGFERSDAFFDLPVEEFKSKIIKQSPQMEEIFDTWLPKMELREMLPGKMRYALDGISEKLTEQGARGLTSALTGAWGDKESYAQVASILKMGMLSSQMRNHYGIGKEGLCSDYNYQNGGAESVFTQIVTENEKTFRHYGYQSEVRLLISPKVIETGSYQYHENRLGSRSTASSWWFSKHYSDRPNIFEFVDGQKRSFSTDNQLMIQDQIPPEYLTGIVLANQRMKDDLLTYLRSKQIVQIDAHGQETILSKPIDKFLWVGNTIYDEMFA